MWPLQICNRTSVAVRLCKQRDVASSIHLQPTIVTSVLIELSPQDTCVVIQQTCSAHMSSFLILRQCEISAHDNLHLGFWWGSPSRSFICFLPSSSSLLHPSRLYARNDPSSLLHHRLSKLTSVPRPQLELVRPSLSIEALFSSSRKVFMRC